MTRNEAALEVRGAALDVRGLTKCFDRPAVDALDLTMEGSFLVGLIAGPYAGATVGAVAAAGSLMRRL